MPNARPPRVVCISQARIGSARLPGKVLMEACGVPLLAHHLGRLKRCRRVDTLVLATTRLSADDPVAAVGRACGVEVFRGDPEDVLDRFGRCAAVYRADVVVRVNADCPLIDPALTDAVIETFLAADPAVDFAFLEVGAFPRGLDTEVIAIGALIEAFENARGKPFREHVTPYIYTRPGQFRLLPHRTGGGEFADLRWCVDEPADLVLVRHILQALLPERPAFGWRDCLEVVQRHPEWRGLNAAVRQKAWNDA